MNKYGTSIFRKKIEKLIIATKSVKFYALLKIKHQIEFIYSKLFNKNKSIEFYMMDSFEIYHFLPIYKELKKQKIKVKYICEPADINISGTWFDYENAINILEELNLDYSTIANPYAAIAISTQHISYLKKYKNLKVNLQYGVGLNKSNFCSTNRATEGYDYRLVHGRYTTDKISNFMNKENIYEMGCPKHDIFFQVPPDVCSIKSYLSIDTQKPILVYFPTWDEDSSIHLFSEELKKLKEKFYIVSKAHHCTFRIAEKQDDLRKLYELSDIVLEGNYPFEKAAILADIAIIDAKSGATCEVPYLNNNIPILYLSVQNDLKAYFFNDIFEFGTLINRPELLVETFKKIWLSDEYIEKRKNKIEYYLGKSDGKSTIRAVNALKAILNKPYVKNKNYND